MIEALRQGLAAIPADTLEPPGTGRVGATLVLLDTSHEHPEIIYTRRQATLSSHPGQISFPGGRVDPGESIVEAAVREAQEEIGLDPSSITVLGRLPAFYIPPSRFWMAAVVALWDRPHALAPNPAEVAEILSVSSETLRQPDRWRAVPLTAVGATWAWQLGPRSLLWGATAAVTGVLMHVMDPQWSGGTLPADLPPDRQVRPWEDPDGAGIAAAPATSRARLSATVTEDMSLEPDQQPSPELTQAAADVVTAIDRLVRRPEGPIVVLVGSGRTGLVAAEVARVLEDRGDVVRVIASVSHPEDFSPTVASAGVIVDGFLGRGFIPPLADPIRSMVQSLSVSAAPLIAIDLPSGLDPQVGLVGDTVSADVTVAISPVVAGHSAPGTLPFLGDLYLSRPGQDIVRVRAQDRPTVWAE